MCCSYRTQGGRVNHLKLTLVAHTDSRQQEVMTAPPAEAQRRCRRKKIVVVGSQVMQPQTYKCMGQTHKSYMLHANGWMSFPCRLAENQSRGRHPQFKVAVANMQPPCVSHGPILAQHLVRAGEGGAERRDLRGAGSARAPVHWSADLERPQHESRRAVLPLDLHTTIGWSKELHHYLLVM